MPDSAKIAITLPRDIYRQVERIRKDTGESRSAVIQRALRQLYKSNEHEAQIRAYVAGYQQHPETDSEVESAQTSAHKLLRQVPWE